MTELEISNALLDKLKDYGAIKWHKTKHHSFYIKFRDVRLGSIRISNHKGREKYNYTYEINRYEHDVKSKVQNIIQAIMYKSRQISEFDPTKYIVFDINSRTYIEVKSLPDYRNIIINKKL